MLRVIEACTKSGGAALSGSDARQAQRAGIVRWRVGPDGERGEAGEACGREGDDGVHYSPGPRAAGCCDGARRPRFSPAPAWFVVKSAAR